MDQGPWIVFDNRHRNADVLCYSRNKLCINGMQ